MLRTQQISIIFLSVLSILALVLIGFVIHETQQASIVIEWSTASELDTVGFNIYRAETSQEAGVRINEQLIPASLDAFTGSDYQFVDTAVSVGRTYYYWLEDVDASGATGRNGPIAAQASPGLWVEWLLIVGLLMILSWGWFSQLRPRRAAPQSLESKT
jgi:hypothetical protein